MSSGIYALGRGSAVVRVTCEGAPPSKPPPPPACCPAILRILASSRLTRSCSLRIHSCSAPSVGGSPCSRHHRMSCSSISLSCFSCCNFIAVAWYIESSETVAIILRVVSCDKEIERSARIQRAHTLRIQRSPYLDFRLKFVDTLCQFKRLLAALRCLAS